ncbi:MAG TPA: carbohydrate ABC transporter permease [Anaerolineae bacterium]|nr:carbohydrate ABC transporter permease [Anaerolineae bacterium]HIP72997.1 carbohydrate ABC transporter permease [Anaerolineae bacterium]
MTVQQTSHIVENQAAKPKKRRRIRPSDIGIAILLWGYAAMVLLPLFLVVSNTMRTSREIFRDPVGLPTSINFDSYVKAWEEASFNVYFFNSLFITVASVALATAVSALAAYILGRYRFRGSTLLSAYFLAGLMMPFRLAIVPLFLLLNNLGLVDSRFGLILVYAATGIPFSVFILSAFFRQLPQELSEAARIDGAGEFTIFGRVMLPLVRPALATVTVFQFIPLWNDFFFPLVLLRSTEKWTLSVGMTRFFGEFQADWSTLFAGLIITTLPLIILFLLATKQIIAGLTAGVSK